MEAKTKRESVTLLLLRRVVMLEEELVKAEDELSAAVIHRVKADELEAELAAIREDRDLSISRDATVQLLESKLKEALDCQVSGFYEEQHPQYSQGPPTHELQDLATAAELNALVKYVQQLENLLMRVHLHPSTTSDLAGIISKALEETVARNASWRALETGFAAFRPAPRTQWERIRDWWADKKA